MHNILYFFQLAFFMVDDDILMVCARRFALSFISKSLTKF